MTEQTYELLYNGTAIKCLLCQRISYHFEDVARRYCAFCCRFHDDHTARRHAE